MNDPQKGGHCDPYLRLHRLRARAVEVLNAQMLLDPSKEQLDAPPRFVKHGHVESWDLQVVGDEDQFLLRFRVVVAHLSQQGGICLTLGLPT